MERKLPAHPIFVSISIPLLHKNCYSILFTFNLFDFLKGYSRRISMNRTESFGVNAPFHFVVLHERTKLPMIYGRITYPVFN